MKFKVLKKCFIPSGGVIYEFDTEIVEAEFYDTERGVLAFYGEDDKHIKMFAPGVWLEVEAIQGETKI